MVPAFDDDADTTAAQQAPVAGLGPPPTEGADAEDSTLQQVPEPPATPTAAAAAAAVKVSAGAGARRGPRRPMMTLLGTGPARATEDDEDSVTDPGRLVSAPAVRVQPPAAARPPSAPSLRRRSSPDAPPSAPSPPAPPSAEPEERFDDTEVRTLVATVGAGPPALAPQARPARPPGAEGEQDSVTARGPTVQRSPAPVVRKRASSPRAPAATLIDPRVEPETPLYTEQPTQPRTKRPAAVLDAKPATGGAAPPAVRPAAEADVYLDDEDSVTTRGNAVEEEDADSITTKAKSLDLARISAAEAEPPSVELLTNKLSVPKAAPAAGAPAPSEEDADSIESVTARAPGNVTEMLRGLAASGEVPMPSPIDQDAEDDLPENHTAVMPNRPWPGQSGSGPAAPPAGPPNVVLTPSGPYLSPFASASSGGVKAAEPMSESGLALAAPLAPPLAPPLDHASVGVMATGPRAAQDAALAARLAPVPETQVAAGKPPRYGALVTAAIAISIAVPVGVFYLLRAGAEVPPSPRAPAAPSSEVSRRDEPVRTKATKPVSSSPRRR